MDPLAWHQQKWGKSKFKNACRRPQYATDACHTCGKSDKFCHVSVMPEDTNIHLVFFCEKAKNEARIEFLKMSAFLQWLSILEPNKLLESGSKQAGIHTITLSQRSRRLVAGDGRLTTYNSQLGYMTHLATFPSKPATRNYTFWIT